jgi:TolB-like protein
MTSTQNEFSHDIFISYRHNDNKPLGGIGEGWVTEFVNYLTTELETMIKGKVSIYFDRNPDNGLKEHHRVEDSLNNRLNSVILIPILSQTYCDEECYAWKNEFQPFLESAKSDLLGSSIRLLDGNVTGRVLPVCIHDLEQQDLRKIESALNGKLRDIIFVFKSPGVNRPLRAHEEDPLKNANRTSYRDQINKVANAIREIITSVRSTEKAQEIIKPKKISSLDSLLSTTGLVKSIAIMPLVFKSQNPDDEFLSQGFAEDLFSSLKQIKALRSSIHGLSSSSDALTNIANSPSSTLVLTGNMTATKETLGIHLQLVQAKTGKQIWFGDYECERDKVFKLRPMIITQICESLSIHLKDNERKSIQHQAEASSAALEYYWKGRFHWRKRGNDLLTSLECFQKAVDLSPGFADAHAGIANASVLLGYYGLIPFQESLIKCKESALKALSIDPTIVEAYYALAYTSLCHELAWPDAEQNFEKVFAINPNSVTAPGKFKNYLTQIVCNFEIAETEVDPDGSIPHFLPAYSLMHKGKFEEGLKVAKIAISKDEGSFMAHRAAGLCYLGLGYGNEAIETLNTAAQLSNRHPWILFDLIGTYAINGNNEEAQSIMEEAMERVNNLPARINDFYFQSI